MQFKKNITYLTIIGLVVYIILMQTCNSTSTPKKSDETVVTFHSETSETIIDTFIIEKEAENIPVYKIKWLVKNRVDTIFLPSEPVLANLDTFQAPINDSLLEATITVYARERPFIDFDYRLKTFETTITNTIKDSTYKEIKIRKGYMSFGATLLGSKDNFGFAPVLQYNRKVGLTYNVGYDVINKNLHIGFTKKISFRKN